MPMRDRHGNGRPYHPPMPHLERTKTESPPPNLLHIRPSSSPRRSRPGTGSGALVHPPRTTRAIPSRYSDQSDYIHIALVGAARPHLAPTLDFDTAQTRDRHGIDTGSHYNRLKLNLIVQGKRHNYPVFLPKHHRDRTDTEPY